MRYVPWFCLPWICPNLHVLCLLQVELPLGATEDRICGTIDIQKALLEGVKAYEPGLLVIKCYSNSFPGHKACSGLG